MYRYEAELSEPRSTGRQYDDDEGHMTSRSESRGQSDNYDLANSSSRSWRGDSPNQRYDEDSYEDQYKNHSETFPPSREYSDNHGHNNHRNHHSHSTDHEHGNNYHHQHNNHGHHRHHHHHHHHRRHNERHQKETAPEFDGAAEDTSSKESLRLAKLAKARKENYENRLVSSGILAAFENAMIMAAAKNIAAGDMLVYLAKQIEQYGRQWDAGYIDKRRFRNGYREARDAIKLEEERLKSASTHAKAIIPERPEGLPRSKQGGRRTIHENRSNKSAVTIQSQWRGRKARSHVKHSHNAASKIQAVHRGKVTRTKVRAHRERHIAARHIQRIHRGKSARRKTTRRKDNKVRHQEHSSVSKIQALRRGQVERRELENQKKAATAIQAAHRGKILRRDLANSRTLHTPGEQDDLNAEDGSPDMNDEAHSYSEETNVLQKNAIVGALVGTAFGAGCVRAPPRDSDSILEISLNVWRLANGAAPILYSLASNVKFHDVDNSLISSSDGDFEFPESAVEDVKSATLNTPIHTIFGSGSVIMPPRDSDSIMTISLDGWVMANGKSPTLYTLDSALQQSASMPSESITMNSKVDTIFGLGSVTKLPRKSDLIASVSLDNWTLTNGKSPTLYTLASSLQPIDSLSAQDRTASPQVDNAADLEDPAEKASKEDKSSGEADSSTFEEPIEDLDKIGSAKTKEQIDIKLQSVTSDDSALSKNEEDVSETSESSNEKSQELRVATFANSATE